MLSGYTLAAARDGGYFVFDDPGPSSIREIMFAGTLTECLAYLRGRFEANHANRPKSPAPLTSMTAPAFRVDGSSWAHT